MTGKTNRLFYFLGKAAMIVGIIAVLLHMTGRLDWFLQFGDCIFKKTTGLYCPGCGGTRAFFALCRLQPVKSFCCHPAVLYFAVVYIVFMIKMFLLKHFAIGREHEGRLIICLYIGIGIILLQWIAKLVCLLVFRVTWI